MGIFKEGKGVRCEPAENGAQRCVVYKNGRGEKLATGTSFGFVLDENCDPVFNGAMDVLEEDEDLVKHVVGEAQAACRKGIRK